MTPSVTKIGTYENLQFILDHLDDYAGKFEVVVSFFDDALDESGYCYRGKGGCEHYLNDFKFFQQITPFVDDQKIKILWFTPSESPGPGDRDNGRKYAKLGDLVYQLLENERLKHGILQRIFSPLNGSKVYADCINGLSDHSKELYRNYWCKDNSYNAFQIREFPTGINPKRIIVSRQEDDTTNHYHIDHPVILKPAEKFIKQYDLSKLEPQIFYEFFFKHLLDESWEDAHPQCVIDNYKRAEGRKQQKAYAEKLKKGWTDFGRTPWLTYPSIIDLTERKRKVNFKQWQADREHAIQLESSALRATLQSDLE